MPNPASTELVMLAWLSTIPGITASMVDTLLPTDTSTWQATGFVQVGPQFGGTPHMYVPVRQPVVQLDTWGVNENQMEPNWEIASQLAELVMDACYRNLSVNIPLTLRAGYRQARVTAAWPVTEPLRIRDDPQNYGHYELDIELAWVEIPE